MCEEKNDLVGYLCSVVIKEFGDFGCLFYIFKKIYQIFEMYSW